jgi:apolipoprotein N-acyltransferase
VIDPAGRITLRLPMYQETAARVGYQYNSEVTFYSAHGDWFAWGCLVAAAVALFWSQLPHYRPVR